MAGGPKNGYRYLAESNLDWGQDLGGLKRYLEKEPVSDVVLSYFGLGLADSVGFRFQDLYSFGLWGEKRHLNSENPNKEILDVSVTNLQGLYFPHLGHDMLYWLKEKRPEKSIGHSIFVYDITGDVSSHERLAHIYFYTGHYDKAKHESRRVLNLQKKSGPGHLFLSFSLLPSDSEGALQEFRRAVQISPRLGFLPLGWITHRLSQQAYLSAFLSMRNLCAQKGYREGVSAADHWIRTLRR